MKLARPRLGLWIAASAVIVVLVLGYRAVRNLTAPDPVVVLRDSIMGLRAVADSCRAGVDASVAGLLAFDSALDSMRSRVRELEALDQRGVPVDSYRVYLEAFNAYNDSAGGWTLREDSVRAQDARCRVLAEEHNALTDSLRRLILERQSR